MYKDEFDQLATKIYTQLGGNVQLSDEDKEVIKRALKTSYDNGYEEGLMDGEEISEKPISG
ncbi:hypothetical protein [Salirhabdus salicampi]|uniref:hypothetical protein n=1 Tax=Salirhabdus salicampi TaxID=476102 RepID=UPI0020C46775|nr:hypothetical protein [Salirhabdus salicampi]MCP8615450.1 hypothetical protein [Salirhabdus salicampi]